VDAFGHKCWGIGEFLAKEIARGTGFECRSIALSHLQRAARHALMTAGWALLRIAAVDLAVMKTLAKW